MLEKIIVLLVAWIPVVIYGGYQFKGWAYREKAVYTAAMAISLYLSLDFALQKRWANLDDLVNFFLAAMAKSILKNL